MSLLEELKSLGVNVDEGLDRVVGDDALYKMMIGMFADMANDNSVSLEDFSGASLSALIERIHVLKDITGNLAITPLYKIYTRVLSLLRKGQAAEAREEFEQILPVQEDILDCIKRNRGDLGTCP